MLPGLMRPGRLRWARAASVSWASAAQLVSHTQCKSAAADQ